MYNKDIYYEIIEESVNVEDNQKYIEEMFTIISKKEKELSTVHNEISRIMNKITNEDVSKRLLEHAQNEYKINYELINKLYYIKHKNDMPEKLNESLKNYCLMISFLREIMIHPADYNQIVGDKVNELKSIKKQLLSLANSDKNTAIRLSKDFIVKMQDVVDKIDDNSIKESYHKLVKKLDSSVIEEDVKMESIKDFIKDLYRLPYKIIMKPFAKFCYSFVIYASKIVNSLLKPFVSLIRKVTHFFQVYLPKKIVNFLTSTGIIKNPLIGTMIEMGFKIAVPLGLNVSLYFLNIFSPRAAMITSFVSSVMNLSRTVVSVNAATETVSSISETMNFLSSFVF